MTDKKDILFLCRRMTELRKKNGINSISAMAEKCFCNKSTLSRVENGEAGTDTIIDWAKKYCQMFTLSEEQTAQFLRGEKIAVPDTSALIKNPQLIDELEKEYGRIVIPDIVINELDGIKNRNSGASGKRAWEIIRGIGYGERIIKMEYTGDPFVKNDVKIISVAKAASEKYGCEVQIITDDADYSAFLKGDEVVTALHLREYMITKQGLVNMTGLVELERYYSDFYEDIIAPAPEELNAYLPDGTTLIISAIRDRSHSFEQRKAKIQWLVAHGADVNKRDCQRRYFPPISHAIQMNDFPMFMFLLKECNADPNIGSRNPHEASKLRQKNEGNMPLMIAAWDGKAEFVKALCEDERTSINQQDANGFTALIKACYWGFTKCRDILLAAGADTRIVDLNGMTAADHYNDYLETGRKKPDKKIVNRRK